MRIAHVFNMANDAWNVCKGLRALGVDAHLIIQRPTDVVSIPQWEEANVNLNELDSIYRPNWEAFAKDWEMPSWVHFFDSPRILDVNRPLRVSSKLLDSLEDYDLIVGHVPFAALAMSYWLRYRRPYAVYDAGWIRYLNENRASNALARWGYRHASKIFFTNVDTYTMFERDGFRPGSLVYVPFAIDIEKYSAHQIEQNPYDGRGPIFFSPSRQDWSEKGNDRVILAFARYLKRTPKALLLLVDWGDSANDLQNAKQLVTELAIRDNVRWLPVMNKLRLVEMFNLSTAVFDQFELGAFGTTAPEAMACSKPVVGYADAACWKRLHHSVPPVLNCQTVDEIYGRMVELEDSSFCEKVGRAGRTWVENTCSLRKVAISQIASYKEILADRSSPGTRDD
jgi:glycosyltransferase involved in cell wall biosynthesis